VKTTLNTHGLFEDAMHQDIILIGNGPSALEHQMGAVIDAFNTVVRFNWFHIKGYEQHVGQKTDIWVTTIFCPERIHWYPYRAIYEHSWDWNPETDTTYQSLKEVRADVIKTHESVIAEMAAFAGNSPYRNYSTGAIAAWLFLKTYPQITLYGFDWWENYRDHHYGDQQKIGRIHQPEYEFVLFSKLVEQGRVVMLDPRSRLNRPTALKYAITWPENRFGQNMSRLFSRKHPLTRRHLIKSVTGKRKSKNAHYARQHAHKDIALMKLMCLCARPMGHRAMYDRLSELAGAIDSWDALPQMAEQHGMAPLVYYHLREAGINIPTAVNRILKSAYLTHRLANRERMAALGEIATLYRQSGIAMLALKGAALANTIYPDPALRCMCDLDLMVANNRGDDARELLKQIGFDVHETASVQPRPLSHHYPPAIRNHNGVGVMVELHHHLYSVSKLIPSVTLDQLLSNAISFNMGNNRIDTLGPEEMLWHAYIHAVGRLQLVERFRLIHVADLVGIVETYAGQIDWQQFKHQYAQTYNALSMLHLFSPWAEAIKNLLPFDTRIAFQFRHFPRLPKAMAVSSRDRHTWTARFFLDLARPPDWWACFFMGTDPSQFSRFKHRVAYPARRLAAFSGNFSGFYVRKLYRGIKTLTS
jgi:hypothetical protein